MLEIREITANRILNPTSIDLGEYVINPYMGCEFSCLYCYVRSNKAVRKRIYFTVNNFMDIFKAVLEPKNPRFAARNKAIYVLLNEGIPVTPYYSPVIPWVTDIKESFLPFEKAQGIEFKHVNFNLKNTHDILENIFQIQPCLKEKLTAMLYERDFYKQTWKELDEEIERQAQEAKKEYKIHRHGFGDFFKNTYW